MKIVLDTSILFAYFTRAPYIERISDADNPFRAGNVPIINVVTKADLMSIALLRGWQEDRRKKLRQMIDRLIIVDAFDDELINEYATIDAYSQGKLIEKPLPSLTSPVKQMAKNDLWIAATASVIKARLLTANAHYDHLHNEFFEVVKVTPLTSKAKQA